MAVPDPDRYRRGDVTASPERVEQRIVSAVDAEGKRHLVVRTRGGDRPQVLVGGELSGDITAALARLIGAVAPRPAV